VVYCVRWLGSQVRVSLTAWIFFSCVCCVGSSLCDGLLTCPKEYYRLCMSNFVLLRNLNNRPELHCCAKGNKIECSFITEFALTSAVGRQWLCSLKADSHIACRAHAAPMPLPCRSPAMPCVNSHMPCRTPALLQQCRVLRGTPRGSRKYPNC
jgi:hypothetical protein